MTESGSGQQGSKLPAGHVEPVVGAPYQQPQPPGHDGSVDGRQGTAVGPPPGIGQQYPQLHSPGPPPVRGVEGSAGWRPEPTVDPGSSTRRRIDPPALVIAAAVLSLVLGAVLVVSGLRVLIDGTFGIASLTRLVFPVVMVLGGVSALRGRRGALTTGAVFLLLTGVVLAVELLGSDRYDLTFAPIEAAVRLGVGVLVIVFSRVPTSNTFFEICEEKRYGRKEADFFH